MFADTIVIYIAKKVSISKNFFSNNFYFCRRTHVRLSGVCICVCTFVCSSQSRNAEN